MNKQEAMVEITRINPNCVAIVAIADKGTKPWVNTEFKVFFEGNPKPRLYELRQDGLLWLRA